MRFRIFSSRLSKGERRVYGLATVVFVAGFLSLIWPVQLLFSRVEPLVLGLPFSLFFVGSILVLNFGVGLALYFWERGRGRPSDDEEVE